MGKYSQGSNKAEIDLRSDTVTRPGAAMREAMMNAPLGDDVYGEDPSVNLLEEKASGLLGKQAGLFVSSGTQGNLLAMLAHCQRGEEYITGVSYHSFCDEAGGASVLGGIVACPLQVDENNSLTVEQVRAAIKPDDSHYPISRLLCLENTVSGKVQPTEQINALAAAAHEQGLSVHLDGARLMNAAIALARPASELVAKMDSVSLCLSKGLGTPVGSILTGSTTFISRARRLRKMVGGGTRQAGVLAACGLFALENNIDRLAEDHVNAQYLYEGLATVAQVEARFATNMVFIRIPDQDLNPLASYLAERNILITPQLPETRLVTHLDINREQIDLVLNSITDYFSPQ